MQKTRLMQLLALSILAAFAAGCSSDAPTLSPEEKAKLSNGTAEADGAGSAGGTPKEKSMEAKD